MEKIDTTYERPILASKFDEFTKVYYLKISNISNKHRVLRDELLLSMAEHYKLAHVENKTKQVSKLYLLDANLHYMKDLIRILSQSGVREISPKNFGAMGLRLNETGKIIGAMIKNRNKK